MKAEGGIEIQYYTFFNLDAIWEWVVNARPRPLYPLERDPVPIVQGMSYPWRPPTIQCRMIFPQC